MGARNRRAKNQTKSKKTENDKEAGEIKSEAKSSSGFGKYLIVVILVLVPVYFHFASPIRAIPITGLEARIPMEGKYQINNLVYKGRRILEGRGFDGPECIAFDSDEVLYTGLSDGRIIKVLKDEAGNVGEGGVQNIQMAKLPGLEGKERPLGMRFFNGLLLIADAYLGLYSLNVTSGKRHLLVDITALQPPSKLIDDFTISKDGQTIYLTSASNTHEITEPVLAGLEGRCTGAVYKFDIPRKAVEMFKDNLCFANGIQLSADDSLLLVGETQRFRINVYDVTTKEIVNVIHLPFMPDNIRPSNDGGYFVGLPVAREELHDAINSSPLFRQLLAGILGERGLHYVAWFGRAPTGVLKLDAEGNVLRLITDPDSLVAKATTSGIEDSSGNLYLGSFFNDFIVKINNEHL